MSRSLDCSFWSRVTPSFPFPAGPEDPAKEAHFHPGALLDNDSGRQDDAEIEALDTWMEREMARRRAKVNDALGGLDPEECVMQPWSTRFQQLCLVLTKPGWLGLLSGQVEDEMYPGIVLLPGPTEVPTLQQEAWQMYCTKNSLFVDSRSLCELLLCSGESKGAGKRWIRSLKLLVDVEERLEERPGSIHTSLALLLVFESLEEVSIEVRSDGENEALVQTVIDEEITSVAMALREQLVDAIVI